MLESMPKACHPMDVCRTTASYIGACSLPPYENGPDMIETEKEYCAQMIGSFSASVLYW